MNDSLLPLRFAHRCVDDFRVTEKTRRPFRYFCARNVFQRRYADALLDWLETAEAWQYAATRFYAQYEFDVRAQDIPRDCAPCFTAEAFEELTQRVAESLEADLSGRPKVIAHRLDRGQGIGIHNDAHDAGGTLHRFVVQLGRGFDDRCGGHLGLFGSHNLRDVHRIVQPLHNTGLGFTISPQSWHAVSDVRRGSRYTLVYTFREAAR